MASEDYVSNLIKVTELRKAIKNKFTAKKLHDQGLESDLAQIYKPLTESQTKNASDLTTHLSNLSNESNKKLIDFKETFKNFPALIASIDQVKSLLDTKTTEIETKDVEEVEEEQEQFESEEDVGAASSKKAEPDIYEYVLKLSEAKKTNDLKKYLADEKNSKKLISFIQNHPDTNLGTNPWRQINIADPKLYQKIKSVKKVKIT